MDDYAGLWDMASTDLEREARSLRLTTAKVAVAGVWPFLALARSGAEFSHRLALVDDHITATVDSDLHDEVIASLREDFRTVAGYGDGEWEEHDRKAAEDHERGKADVAEIMRTKKYPPGKTPAYDPDNAHERHVEMNPHIYDPSGDKADAARKQGSSFEPGRNRRKLDPDDPADARLIRQKQRGDEDDDDEGDRRWDMDHKSSLRASTGASLWDNLDEAPTRHQQHVAHRETPAPSLTFFHAGLGRWVSAAEESPGNPYYPDPEPEVGPNQGQSGYPNMAPDPPNRTLDQYQNAVPAQWGDNTPWVDQGNAATGQTMASRRTAAGPLMGGPMNWGESGPGGGLQWEHHDDHEATGFHPESGEEMATISAPVGQRRPMMHYYPHGGRTRESDEMHAHVDHKDEGIARANYHFDQQQMQRQGARRQRRTAKAPPMDPQDAETRAHVCMHCGEQDPRATEPCKENGSYCQSCNGPGCARCGNAGEVFGTHHVVVGVRRRAQVEESTSANPGYFDGTGGLTGDGASPTPPPITGNPQAGPASYTPTSEPLENRADWYGEMTGQAQTSPGVTGDDGTEGQGFEPGNRRGASFYDPRDPSVRTVGFIEGGDAVDGDGGKDMAPGTMEHTLQQMNGRGGDSGGGSNVPQGGGDSGGSAGAPSSANVPQDSGASDSPGMPSSGGDAGGATKNLMDVSTQAARRALAAAGGGGPSAPSGGGGAPPPPQMQAGGPGAEAMPPMGNGAQQSGPAGGAAGNVPQSSKPRQMPGGGGGAPAPGGAPGKPGGASSGAAPGTPKAGRRAWAAGVNKEIATPDNPSGVGDEFSEGAFENQMNQKPRQQSGDRRPNTPQNPGTREPIPTTSSGSPGEPDDDDEDDRREAVRRAVALAMAGGR